MAKKNRHKDSKDSREPGGFVALPYAVLRSQEWSDRSARAVKLLCDLMAQLRGDNNGDLCAAMKIMRPRGWRSKALLSGAIAELEQSNFIIRTRQGGRNRAALYGVTFFRIEWCAGKLDIEAPTRRFMGAWRTSPAPLAGQQVHELPHQRGNKSEVANDCPAGRPSHGPFRHPAAPPAGSSIDSPSEKAIAA